MLVLKALLLFLRNLLLLEVVVLLKVLLLRCRQSCAVDAALWRPVAVLLLPKASQLRKALLLREMLLLPRRRDCVVLLGAGLLREV